MDQNHIVTLIVIFTTIDCGLEPYCHLDCYLLLLQDLNRIKEKPYTDTVDSDGRPDEVGQACTDVFFVFGGGGSYRM